MQPRNSRWFFSLQRAAPWARQSLTAAGKATGNPGRPSQQIRSNGKNLNLKSAMRTPMFETLLARWLNQFKQLTRFRASTRAGLPHRVLLQRKSPTMTMPELKE